MGWHFCHGLFVSADIGLRVHTASWVRWRGAGLDQCSSGLGPTGISSDAFMLCLYLGLDLGIVTITYDRGLTN